MAAYEKAHIDEIASRQWPHWIPVRHHFGIETFGVNLWRGRDDGTLIPEHDHAEDGEPELYYTVDGHATTAVTLVPKDPSLPFAKATIWVDDDDADRARTIVEGFVRRRDLTIEPD